MSTRKPSKHRGRRLLLERLELRALLAAGTFDAGFGGVTTDFGGDDLISSPSAIAIQADGKIVAVGQRNSADFVIARYESDGSIDVSFGVSGKVTHDLGAADDRAHAVLVQPDGKIVVGGRTASKPVLVRYDSNGVLDPSFGTGGVSVLASVSGAQGDKFTDLELQLDGKIVGSINGDIGQQLTVARIDELGNLDMSFSGDGIADIDFLGAGPTEFANSLALQSDGMIVVTGRVTAATPDLVLARLTATGTLDAGFGSGGKVQADFGGIENGYDVELQSDGSMVIGGNDGASAGQLWRFSPAGVHDASFAATPYLGGASSAIFSIEITADDKIVAAMPFHSDGNFNLARFEPDGLLDASFGIAGLASHDFGSFDQAFTVKVQADGKLVVGGNTGSFPNRDFALARFLGDVLTPEVQLDNLILEVNALVSSGDLNAGQGKAVTQILASAQGKLLDGQVNAAKNKLSAARNKIQAWINAGALGDSEGAFLLAALDDVLASL